jgi:hypothetical protein
VAIPLKRRSIARAYLAAEIGAAVLGVAALTSYAYQGWFFLDDFANMTWAREIPLWELIWRPAGIGHFNPGHWVLDWIVVRPLSMSRLASGALLAVFLAVGLWAFVRALDELFGTHPINPVLAALCGTSWVLVNPTGWFAVAVHPIPSFSLWCVALYCFARWRRQDEPGWAVASVGASAAGLMFSSETVVVPVILVLCTVLVPCRSDAPLRRPGGRARDLVVCSGHVLVCVLLVAFERTRPYAQPVKVPSVSEALTFMRVAFFEMFLPTVVGLGSDAVDLYFDSPLRILVPLLLGAGLVVSIVTRRCGLRAVVLLGAVFALIVIVVLPSRGLPAAVEYRYFAPLPLGFWLSVRLAMTRRPGTRPANRGRQQHKRISLPPIARPVAVSALSLALVLYGANFVRTAKKDDFFIENGRAAHAIVGRIRTGTDTAAAQRLERSFVDIPLPYPVAFLDCGPGVVGACNTGPTDNLLSRSSAAVDHRIVPRGEGTDLLAIAEDGTVDRMAFHPVTLTAGSDSSAETGPVQVRCRSSCKTAVSFTTGNDQPAYVRLTADRRERVRIQLHTKARLRLKQLPTTTLDLSGRARTVPVWTAGTTTITVSATSRSTFGLGIEAGTLEQLGPLNQAQ